MKLAFLLPFLFCILISRDLSAQKHQFSLQSLAEHDPIHLTWHKEKDHLPGWIECKSDSFPWMLALPGFEDGYAWNSAKYLVIELEHDNQNTTVFQLHFYSEHYKSASPNIEYRTGILPGLPTQVVFPISALSEHFVNTPRYVRQLKGALIGEPMNPTAIKKVLIHLAPVQWPDVLPHLKIHNIYLAGQLPDRLAPPIKPLVDSLWQWSSKSWSGKTKDRKALNDRLEKYKSDEKASSFESTHFQGYSKLKWDASGFFSTHFDGERWWLADPEGYAFLSTGINSVRASVSGPVEGNEDLFSWLPGPAKDGQGLYFKAQGVWNLNYLGQNFQSVLGKNWTTDWRKFASNTLKKNGFNTLGIYSDPELVKESQMPYMCMLKNFPSTPLKVFKDFPDVFDPAFRDSVRHFALQLKPFLRDHYLIGYFLGNQPDWASDNSNMALEMLKNPQKSKTRSRLNKWLSTKYKNDITKLNASWVENYASFSELDSGRIKDVNSNAQTDLEAFTAIMVDSLIAIVCVEMKKVDPEHLNFGFRFSFLRKDLCHRDEHTFDVFSIIGNDLSPPEVTQDIRMRTGKPVFISEFHVGATDRGLPSSGLVAAKNQEERGYAIQNYVEEGFSRPEIIGIHYYQLYDQPFLGRFDGENYGLGLFDVCNKAYEDPLTSYHTANSRLYSIARGKKSPSDKKITPIKPIWF